VPKQVDHEARRRLIAEALWRIASTRGLEGASLRDVAAEAGISLGQLQHYFTSKEEMLAFALDHISALAEQRVRSRVQAVSETPEPRTVVRETLAEMLPLDDKSRTGNLVQIAYFVRAVHSESARGHAKKGVPGLRRFLADQLARAAADGTPHRHPNRHPDRHPDPDEAAMLLIALVDGLTTYTLLDVLAPDEALKLLDRQLDLFFA